jgi:aminoglycoside phosphotransferase (APT) family kinase protein
MNEMLTRIVKDQFGSARRITSWSRRKSAYSSSCQITNLQVELDGGEWHSFVLKELNSTSWLPTAQQVRPAFLYDSQREIHVYRNILSELGLGTPRYLGSQIDTENHRQWLMLERARGPLLWQVGQDSCWQASAGWLATFHQCAKQFSQQKKRAARTTLVDYGEEYFLEWAKRAERFLSIHLADSDAELARQFRKIFNRYDRVARFLSQLPRTLVHGEYYPSNVIIREDGRGRHVCPIDWELAGRGSGILDLAALSFGDWSPEKKGALIRAYREVLPPTNDLALTLQETHEAVEYGHLHFCMRQLGWASEWQPPDQHSKNWVEEALILAKKLAILS